MLLHYQRWIGLSLLNFSDLCPFTSPWPLPSFGGAHPVKQTLSTDAELVTFSYILEWQRECYFTFWVKKKKKGFEAGGKKGTDKNTDFKARRYPYILKICKLQNVAHKCTQCCSLSYLHNVRHTLSKRILVAKCFPLALPSLNDQFTW